MAGQSVLEARTRRRERTFETVTRSAPPRAEIDQLPDGAEDLGDRTDQGAEAIASPSVDDDQEDPLRRSAPRPE